jgi:hypothetical protein
MRGCNFDHFIMCDGCIRTYDFGHCKPAKIIQPVAEFPLGPSGKMQRLKPTHPEL